MIQNNIHKMLPSHRPRKQLRQGDMPDVTTARKGNSGTMEDTPSDVESYFAARRQLQEEENRLSFDHRCRQHASALEQKADAIVHKLRKLDNERIYDTAGHRAGHDGQTHRRFAGDHFLSNTDLIPKTALFDVARHMPKGAHLHIHFNACLPPSTLLDIAKTMERMYIMCSRPLLPDDEFESYRRSEFQFSIMCQDRAMQNAGDIFSRNYEPWGAMRLSEFLERFGQEYAGVDVDEWLYEKLAFGEAEAHGLLQTASG